MGLSNILSFVIFGLGMEHYSTNIKPSFPHKTFSDLAKSQALVDLPGRSSYMVLGLQVLTHRHFGRTDLILGRLE